MDLKDIDDPTPPEEYARRAEERRKQGEERVLKNLAQDAKLHSQQMRAVIEKDAQLARIELKIDEVLELLRRER
ncbi:hypothetical protein E4191_15905 (plasmid) [Paracoccus liaowanqingii]|uniref:Uncharacterized protein n=1 Tax=Paracoccus liaowanqingii TaxID=2560053 RepID=A0A4Y5SRR3_9RHOB|nr:hypothetical protein [Paracoccus liaowanqingii]QDA35658.1 hypothetical protein E4191_15905 [Paracoccus liaowanqingii]